MASAQQVPSAQQKRFMDLYRQGQIKDALREAEILTRRYPHDAFAWKALGNCLLQLGDFAEAAAALETAYHLTPEDPLVLNAFSRARFHTNQLDKALELQEKSLELEPNNAQGHYNMASMLHQSGSGQRALQHLDQAEERGFDTAQILSMRSIILSLSFRFQEGLDELLKLYELRPDDPTVHNSLGNYYKDMADFAKAEAHYQKAKALAPKYATAYSNEILSRHYNPVSTVADILEAAQEWHRQFACQTPYVHTSDSSASSDKLRIGIVSGSLRLHPVGWMITNALSNLPEDIELYIYSDSEPSDFIAQRIQQIATQWQPIYHLDQQQVAEHIHGDQIHILIDLAGHGADSRLPAIVMKPAPLIIKWVGMQISSMGIPEFDYFLSDSIETPPGVDDQYTEKLIRLPDDYVCYRPPYYKPAITALPAITNGYITLGCFNNPAKVNDVVLREWAKLMYELPNSRLLLKGGQYSSPEVCERIRTVMANAGINDERLILEGPSKHQELLESYHRVDIALDPWPYSGGLTTCEAMLMGVPVVTLPGPTFAGRHSATHLTNAGMQELVVSSWEEYRQRVIELASDLPSLAVIRAALRTYLEQSPVCDGERFARHLHKALRAIWQRHCEGKPPAALTFNKGGQAWFEDDSSPVKLPTELQRGFDWDLESPVTILDNGAGIAMRSDARELLGSGNIAVLAFDPINALDNAEELAQYGEIQHFPHVTLGNGQPATLRGVEGENDITSLKPLASGIADSLQTLEIPSITLDSIEGLESLDVLALDDRHDNLAILEHGAKALEKALLLQIRIRFNPTHEGQTDLGSLTRWASEHGFRFYRLHNAEYRSHLPDDAPTELKQASELVSADALFVPNETYAVKMGNEHRAKLAYILSSMFEANDIAYNFLNTIDQNNALEFLKNKGFIKTGTQPKIENIVPAPAGPAIPQSEHVSGKPVVSVVCATYNHHGYIEDAIKGFIAQKTNFPFEVIIHDDASTDGTQAIIQKYAEEYPRLIRPIYQKENKYSAGLKPLDICLPLTEGKYIAICEGDDYWTDSTKLQTQHDYMEQHSNCVITHHNAFVFKDDIIISESKLPAIHTKGFNKEELLKNECFILTLSIMFRKVFNKFPKEKGKAENGDNFLISMLGLYGESAYLGDIAPAAYRLHGSSTWSSKSEVEKSKMRSNSFYWIGKYHERKHRPEVAKYYLLYSEELLIVASERAGATTSLP